MGGRESVSAAAPTSTPAGNVSRRILASWREIFSSILAAAALKRIYSFTFRGLTVHPRSHALWHGAAELQPRERRRKKCKCTLGKRRIWRNNTEAGRNVVGRVGLSFPPAARGGKQRENFTLVQNSLAKLQCAAGCGQTKGAVLVQAVTILFLHF